MNDLLYLVPSRGRPGNARRLITAWGETQADRVADLLFIVDMDDYAFGGYPTDVPPWVKIAHNHRRTRIVPGINKWSSALVNAYDAVGFMGDDHLPRTIGWAQRTLEAISEGSHVVYGNDLAHGVNLPTAVCLSSPLVSALGYMAPRGLVHLYVDNAWKIIGERLDALCYLGDDVVIEHVHPHLGKAEMDTTYAEANASDVWDADKAEYERWVAQELDADIARVREAFVR